MPYVKGTAEVLRNKQKLENNVFILWTAMRFSHFEMIQRYMLFDDLIGRFGGLVIDNIKFPTWSVTYILALKPVSQILVKHIKLGTTAKSRSLCWQRRTLWQHESSKFFYAHKLNIWKWNNYGVSWWCWNTYIIYLVNNIVFFLYSIQIELEQPYHGMLTLWRL